MKVYVYTFRDGYCCWQSAMSAAERRAEERARRKKVFP